MRCLPPWSLRVVLALMAGLPCASSWAVDWQMGRGRWTGAVGLGASFRHNANDSAGTSTSGSAYLLQESLRVQGSGLYVLDRRLINANLGFTIGFNQFQYSGSSAASRSDQRVTDYNLSAGILESKPYPIQVYANLSQIDANLDYGGRSVGRSENRGFSVSLKEDSPLKAWVGPWFNATLSAREAHLQQTSSYFDRVTQIDQTRRTVEATAQKGFTTADLRLRYLATDQSNAAQAQAGNQFQVASANYNLDFGPGLNRNFDSTLSYATSNTVLPSNTLTATEALSIVHSRSLASDYNYAFSRDEAEGAVTLRHAGGVGVSHQLYKNLSTRMTLQGDQVELEAGTLFTYRGNFSQSYQHSLPGGGSLGLNWAGNYQRSSSALSVGIVNVSEQFSAPAVTEPAYRLERPFVIDSSIRVYNLRDAPFEQELVRGTDYTVEVIGNFTYIRPIYPVQSSPDDPVVPGDPLKVTYDVQIDPNLESESRGTGYGVAVGYGWIGASYNHQQSTSKPLSGEALYLFYSSRNDTVNLYMNGSWRGFATSAFASHERSSTRSFALEELSNTSRLELQGSGRLYSMDARGTANFERYRGTLTAFDRRMLQASLFWKPAYEWQMAFSASASNTQYLNPARQFTQLSARGAFNWNPASGWRNEAFAEVRTQEDSTSPRSTLMQLGARTALQMGKLSFSSAASVGYSVSGNSRGLSESISITVRRALW